MVVMTVMQRMPAAGLNIKCINHKPTDESHAMFTNKSVHTLKESNCHYHTTSRLEVK